MLPLKCKLADSSFLKIYAFLADYSIMVRGHTSPAGGLYVEECPLLTLKPDLASRNAGGLCVEGCPLLTLKPDLAPRNTGGGVPRDVLQRCCRVLERMRIVLTGKNKVEIKIAGKDYTVVGAESEEYIQRVGLYIDRKMVEIMRVNSKLSTSMAAVLAAINVADDYFKSHESETNLKKELKKLTEENEALKGEKKRLTDENAAIGSTNTSLQLELAKREAELREVRNSIEKAAHPR